MPFKSKAQQRFMFSQHPEMAKEWADKTPDISKLPEHVKKMADGGDITSGSPADIDSQGMQTPPEVLAALAAMTGGAPEGLTDALGNEAGEISLGGNAPEMEEAPNQVQAFIKGVQKNPNGADIKIWGVKGPPEILKSMFGDESPGSVPEAVLKAKGIIPDTSINIPGQNAPNGFAYGGETNPKKETLSAMENNPTAGFADGGEVKDKVNSMSDIGTLKGLRDLMMKAQGGNLDQDFEKSGSTDTPKNYDDGGEVTPDYMQGAAQMAAAPVDVENGAPPPPPAVDQDFINKLQAGTALTPEPNPIAQSAQAARNIPPTQPNIYQGITADQRAQLMQQLLAQKSSPGMLAVKGAAGLGDAITGAFGKGPTNALGNIQAKENENIAARSGIVDTQRTQRLQDLQANLAQQENDPASAYSTGMRQFYSQLTGKQFPSGISASMMKSAFPDYAKIFDSQLTAATAQAGQKVEAQKAGATRTVWQRLVDSIAGPEPAETALQNTATGGMAQPKGASRQTPSGISYTVNE